MKRRTPLLTALAIAGVAAVIGGLAATACSSEDGARVLPATPRPTQVLPTPFPTATPPVIRPWGDVTPVPAVEAGRGDCPEGWNGYSDPDGHFSLCYPPGLQATAGPAVSGDRGAAVNIVSYAEDSEGTPINTFLVAAAWSPSKQILIGPDSPLDCADMELVTRQQSIRPADLVVAGRNATGCHAVGSEVGPTGSFQQGSIVADIPVNEDGTATSGFIGISIDYTGPDLEGTLQFAKRILETLAIPAAATRSWQDVTPVPAAEAGRLDCLEGWSAYSDPDGHFSVCYPADWAATASRPRPEGAFGVTLSSPGPAAVAAERTEGPVVISAWWQGPEARDAMIESQCGTFEAVWDVPVEKLTVQIAGATATACRAMGTSENVDEGTVELLVLDPAGGGVVEVFAHPAPADLPATDAVTRQVLATLKVPAG